VVDKAPDGKESLKITIKAPILRRGGVEESIRQPEASQPVRPVHTIGQTDLTWGHPAPSV
jgi:hypothetical protein